jgi:hypothetical protein
MNQLIAATLSALLGIAGAATVRPVDNGLMTNVPNFGPSRVETVNFCVKQAGVDKYQDLTTDYEFEGFEKCLMEMT